MTCNAEEVRSSRIEGNTVRAQLRDNGVCGAAHGLRAWVYHVSLPVLRSPAPRLSCVIHTS